MELPLALLGLLLGGSPAPSPVILWAADSGIPRADHGAALLPDGRVMVVGGRTTAEQRYDPADDSWSDGGTGLDTHAIYSLARLQDATLIVVDNSPTYEWWSPAAPDWTAAPSGAARQNGVAVLLSSGQLLTGCGDDGTSTIPNFERFDEVAGVWFDAGAQLVPGSNCALSPLPGDRWLTTGGSGAAASVAELWSLDGGRQDALQYARAGHTSTVLPGGRVLVTGGTDTPAPVEIFDPATETWEDAGAAPSAGRYRASATVLPDGRVLVAGGFDGSNFALDTAELYDPVSGLWSAPFQLGIPRGAHVAVMLPNGRVLLTGGDDGVDATESSELLDFSSPFVTPAEAPPPPLAAPRFGTARGAPVLWDDQGAAAFQADPDGGWIALPPAPPNPGAVAVALADGRLLRVGASADGYDPDRNAWFTVPSPDAGHVGAAVALLGTGEVLVAGGEGPSAVTERFDPRTATWSTAESLPMPTRGAQAISLPGGDAMVCGGETAAGVTDWCWIYTTSTSHWTFGLHLLAARRRFSVTVLESGKVLAAGGENDGGLVGGAELFQPSAVSWTPAAPLLEPRSGHAAIRLRNGQVLVIGGMGAGGALATTEQYDPVPRAFAAGPSLGGPRGAPAAAMALDGQVLIAGAEDGRLESFDEGRGAQPQWAPVLGPPPRGRPGTSLTGARLTGVTPGSSGNLRNSPSDLPVLSLVGADGVLVRPGALGWTPTQVTFQVPPSVRSGWVTLSASVNGIESNALPFLVGQGAGQPCDAGADCAAGTCAGGLCVAPPEIVWVPPDAGGEVDAGGQTDAGGEPDAGPAADAGTQASLIVGCGCTSAPGAWAGLLLLAAALGYRRRSLNARSRVPSARDDVTHSSISGST